MSFEIELRDYLLNSFSRCKTKKKKKGDKLVEQLDQGRSQENFRPFLGIDREDFETFNAFL
jgi:hypothetical protein